ncbi:Uncharacterized protein TCM_020309 [Theobroma cacao]|uniref:Rad60/SUMO-like domain-containing protein n=1 Tax=Theobroma cacao TaxID=3641 RepID=A0A061ELM8_THECC|nr:Uncharacterized protein TCM_020309 [Theobroma cacao]
MVRFPVCFFHSFARSVICRQFPLDGNEVHVKIRRGTKIKKLLTAYCRRYFLTYNTVQFLIDGCPFADDKTPEIFDNWPSFWPRDSAFPIANLGLEVGGEMMPWCMWMEVVMRLSDTKTSNAKVSNNKCCTCMVVEC